MKALSVSLNFNPGHFSHLMASYRMFEDLGYQSEMLLAPEFALMDAENHYTKNYSIRYDKIINAIFWFPSLKNISAIRKLTARGCKVFYVFHEPFDSISDYRNGGFSWVKIAKIALIDTINILTLKTASGVILPSVRAQDIYKKKYKKYNKNFYQIPLLFDDECGANIDISKKIFISYIGTIAEDHAFNKFVEFIKYSVESNVLPNYRFLIATKSTLPTEVKEMLRNERIEIIDGRPLTNEEINKCYEKSAVVWNAYNRSMQSGVLPKAFMFGTPVITGKNIINENFCNKQNGIAIEDNGNLQEILGAVLEITDNLKRYSNSARQTFLHKFYYKKYIPVFREILQK